MEKDLILTCDTGTTGCKCTLFNVKGEALFAVRRGYPTQYPHPNWAEQDPDVILVVCYMKNEISYACVECQKKVLVSMSIELHEEMDKSGVDESWAEFIYGQGDYADEEKDLAKKVQAVEEEIHSKLIKLMWQSHKGEYDYDKLWRTPLGSGTG